MKKQLLIAAVAATMGTAAMADISISGNGKYVYTNTDISTGEAATTANAGTTEINLAIDGKNGDTQAHLEFEIVESGTLILVLMIIIIKLTLKINGFLQRLVQ